MRHPAFEIRDRKSRMPRNLTNGSSRSFRIGVATVSLIGALSASVTALADENAERIKGFYDSCMADAKTGVERNPLIRLPPEMNLMCACAAGALNVVKDRDGDSPASEKAAAATKGCFRTFAGAR